MLAPWVIDEMQTAELNDEHWNDRLREVLSPLAARPTASIPAACGGRAEMEAAYRLFDNDKVRFDNILQPHRERTRQRIAEQQVVILVQDTTLIDLTRPEQQVQGAGPLGEGDRLGAVLHLLHAFTPDGTPLGTVQAVAWAREEEPAVRQTLTAAQRKARPLEEKESYRWVVALREAQEEARRNEQTQIICVADSEADIYELLAEGTGAPPTAQWIVRACQDRALQGELGAPAASLHESVLARGVLLTKTITVRGRKAKVACSTHRREQPRQARQCEVEVRAAQLTLRPPRRAGQLLPAVTVNVVLVREPSPPAGEEPVEWMLLTSLPIDHVEQVRQVIEHYCVR